MFVKDKSESQKRAFRSSRMSNSRNMAYLRMTIDISSPAPLSPIAEPPQKLSSERNSVMSSNNDSNNGLAEIDSLEKTSLKKKPNSVPTAKRSGKIRSTFSNYFQSNSVAHFGSIPRSSNHSNAIRTQSMHTNVQQSSKGFGSLRPSGVSSSRHSDISSATSTPATKDIRTCASYTPTSQISSSSRSPSVDIELSAVVNSAHVPHFDLKQDPSFWKHNNVQVLVRIRPLNGAEVASKGYARALEQESSHTVKWLGIPEARFTFDHVACETITQGMLFKVTGVPVVENCISGYNSCMFVYGQTGSGKTHTMIGDLEQLDQDRSENRGMAPRVFEYLFASIESEEESHQQEQLKYTVRCSFLEIYNEQITDLLKPSSTNLQLREDAKRGVYVENITEIEVKRVQDVLDLLVLGATNRRIASTNMNSESSRSHTVFTCMIERQWKKDSVMIKRYGRLNLVDLAGSERQKTSDTEELRLKEAAHINKSLSALGLVIMMLADRAHGKQRHVPYRDSKLTFLLQDSLGGNSKTTIIANVSPSICSANETLSTLRFAQRAKNIQNNAIINEEASGLDRNSQRLQQKLKAVEAALADALRREQIAEKEKQQLEEEIKQLNLLIHQKEIDAECIKRRLSFKEGQLERLESITDEVLSEDGYNVERQRNATNEELQSMQGYHEFCETGDREALLAEISSLRNQLVEALAGHPGNENNNCVSLSPMEEVVKEMEDRGTRLEAALEENQKLSWGMNDLHLQIEQLKEVCNKQAKELETLRSQTVRPSVPDRERTGGQIAHAYPTAEIESESDEPFKLREAMKILKAETKHVREENTSLKFLDNGYGATDSQLPDYHKEQYQALGYTTDSLSQRNLMTIHAESKAPLIIADNDKALDDLQSQLQITEKSTCQNEENGECLKEATATRKVKKLEHSLIADEIAELKSVLKEKLSIIQEMENDAEYYRRNLKEANKRALVAFIVVNNRNDAVESMLKAHNETSILVNDALQINGQHDNINYKIDSEKGHLEPRLVQKMTSLIEFDRIHDKEIGLLKTNLNESLAHITFLQQRNKELYDQVKFLENSLQSTLSDCAKYLKELDGCQRFDTITGHNNMQGTISRDNTLIKKPMCQFRDLEVEETKDKVKFMEAVDSFETQLSTLQDRILLLPHQNAIEKSLKFTENVLFELSTMEARVHAFFARAEDIEADYKKLCSYIDELMGELLKKDTLLKKMQTDFTLLQEPAIKVRNTEDDFHEKLAKLMPVQDECLGKGEHMTTKETETGTIYFVDNILRTIMVPSSTNSQVTTSKNDLVVKGTAKKEELEERQMLNENLKKDFSDMTSLVDDQMSYMVERLKQELTKIQREKDILQAEVASLRGQLQVAQAYADEHQATAAEARETAEARKASIEQKEEEVRILVRCVEELESTVNALEAQVDMVRGDAERQRLVKEDLEAELQSLKHYLLTAIENGHLLTEAQPFDRPIVIKEHS